MSGSGATPEAPAFEARALARAYAGRTALAPLDLVVARGESVALVGPSGAGKTTLLGLLAGLVPPTSGSVSVMGVPMTEMASPAARARAVGVLPQQLDLVPNLAVVHNVLAGRLGQWSTLRALVSLVRPLEVEVALDALRRVGLEDRAFERTGRLSGGEQQRVALARLA